MTTAAMRSNAPTSTKASAWTLVWAQYGYALLYAVCAYAAMAHAADLAGRWYVPAQGDAVTESLDVTGWAWSIPAGMVLTMAPVLAGLGLLVSGLAFLVRLAGGNRRLTRALIGSTAVMLVLLIVSLTPAAQSVGGWLLD
ncbi:hypothetical protein KOI35_15545 [Actinoplanes bogorensis]|uniref:Uncharacterized protein n=1 Tax=Paractinoplanes bogorensis TaxID=1610840 RepID=A0ABS5YN72_9ACTN|nr:hypothetical protein [Actinoplanes bogorensis]MBU2664916.1 hypothetical protein [Actinoplanes bogorensis]